MSLSEDFFLIFALAPRLWNASFITIFCRQHLRAFSISNNRHTTVLQVKIDGEFIFDIKNEHKSSHFDLCSFLFFCTLIKHSELHEKIDMSLFRWDFFDLSFLLACSSNNLSSDMLVGIFIKVSCNNLI